MASSKTNTPKKELPQEMHGSKPVGDEELTPLDKDYAHYPPTPTKIVTKHLTKKLKETEMPNTDNNVQDNKNSIGADDERIVNGSRKIVNSDNNSVGSGGAFEATEQVLK